MSFSDMCREADDNTTVMGRRVPQGCPIMMPSWALHTSSANYEQPQRFWPERWAAQPMSDFDPARHSESRHCVCICYKCKATEFVHVSFWSAFGDPDQCRTDM